MKIQYLHINFRGPTFGKGKISVLGGTLVVCCVLLTQRKFIISILVKKILEMNIIINTFVCSSRTCPFYHFSVSFSSGSWSKTQREDLFSLPP